MPVPTQPAGCLSEWQERKPQPTEESKAVEPEGDRGKDRPDEEGKWQAYSIDVLTAFFDP
jgi:hypothetical protein